MGGGGFTWGGGLHLGGGFTLEGGASPGGGGGGTDMFKLKYAKIVQDCMQLKYFKDIATEFLKKS